MSKFELTDMICPECGNVVYKHFHRRDRMNHTYEYVWFWCSNFCVLGCGNCISADTHGECGAQFCINKSNWKPKNQQ